MPNFLRPVTMSRASIRFCGVPRIVKSDADLSVHETVTVRALAAASASEP